MPPGYTKVILVDRFFLPSIIGSIIPIVAGSMPAPTAASTAALDGLLVMACFLKGFFLIIDNLSASANSFWLSSTVLNVFSTSRSPP